MKTLVSCTRCQRHARIEETACPFCGGALAPPVPLKKPAKRGRYAILFSATLATTAAGCGGSQSTAEEPVAQEPVAQEPVSEEPVAQEPGTDPDEDPDYSGAVAEYGAPAPEE